ncbi:MAG TPA: ribonuclease R family protein, partial [Candidatus Obscuribacterales bacterium]
MEFTIATLLTNFSDDKLVAPKVLEKKLSCEDDTSLRKLQIALDALERIGILTKDRGRYRRVSENDVVEGKLRCSSKGFCFAIQDSEGADDIYVRESQLNTAWNGDRVLVRVTKEGSRRRSPEGEVRLILERANNSVLARVKKVGDEYRAVPLDDRLLFELELQPGRDDPDGKRLEEAVDQLVHVGIVRYPLGQNRPLGRVAQILGSDAEAASDIDIVCCKYDLPRIFSEDVLQAAKALPTKLRKSDLKGRMDLRHLPTVSIVGSKNPEHPIVVDDALTLETLPPKKKGDAPCWRVGVHIADVSYYIPFGSPLDVEAQRRGTSIYLGETVLPMLPEKLHQCCALAPGHDRLAISVLLTIDSDGNLVEFELQPTLIQVDHQLDYQQVETILHRNQTDVPPSDETSPYPLPTLEEVQPYASVFELLDQLFTLSQVVQTQRHARGAFELNLPEK